MATIQFKRGNAANLPGSGLAEGEPLFTLDRGNLHVATAEDAHRPVTPAIDALQELDEVDAVGDLLIVHDASADAGQREKKLSIAALRQSMNIPAGSSDELVAAVEGGTAGYLFGTNNDDGVLRAGEGLEVEVDAGNGFATLRVTRLDGGTF